MKTLMAKAGLLAAKLLSCQEVSNRIVELSHLGSSISSSETVYTTRDLKIVFNFNCNF